MKFNNVLIYGLGLMGASLSLVIKSKKPDCKVTGIVRSSSSKEEGTVKKIADIVITEKEFLNKENWNEFDFIVLALPVDSTIEKINSIPSDFPGFITDLGSTKSNIISAVEKKYQGEHNYYSSHPMAGSEQSGLNHASVDLYKDRLCILTEPSGVGEKAKRFIKEFWEFVGMKIIEINSKDHDEILSYLSHTPHILSSLLALWAFQNAKVKSYTEKSPLPLTGGGFRDMTRIAGSNPEMWQAIFHTNKENVKQSLVDFREELGEIIDHFDTNPDDFWIRYFEKAKKSRNEILKLN